MTLPCSIWHIFDIEMDETMYFISHIGHETKTYCWRKTHIIFCIVLSWFFFDPPSSPRINFGIWRYVQHIDDRINKLTCQIPCFLENEVLLVKLHYTCILDNLVLFYCTSNQLFEKLLYFWVNGFYKYNFNAYLAILQILNCVTSN